MNYNPNNNNNINNIDNEARVGLLSSLWRFGVGLLMSLLPGPLDDPDSVTCATRFQMKLMGKYGEPLPRLFIGSFDEAINKAKRDFKFLLVYLHSDIHENTPRFCRKVLCTERITSFIDEHFIVWAGDVQTAEGFKISNLLAASTYPFFAVCSHFHATPYFKAYLLQRGYNIHVARHSGIVVFEKIEGMVSAEELMTRLSNCVEEHEILLVTARAEMEEREMDRRIRAEQNRAFEESQRLDAEKERLRREAEEKKKREEEERRRIEEQKRIQEELRQKEREMLLKKLPEEPAKSDPNTSQIVIRLSDGSRIQRRFRYSDSLQNVFDFVRAKEPSNEKYILVSQFPRKVYTDPTMTIQAAGLFPQALLYVEEEISSSNTQPKPES